MARDLRNADDALTHEIRNYVNGLLEMSIMEDKCRASYLWG